MIHTPAREPTAAPRENLSDRRLPWVAMLGIGAIALLLGWRIVVTNTSDYLAQSGGADAASIAIHWNPGNPAALYERGIELVHADPAKASASLIQAISRNPADAPAYAVLARLRESEGNLEAAGKAIETAARLAPLRVDVQLEAGAFWMRRNDPARAMPHFDIVLTYGGPLRSELFPQLLALAEDPVSRQATFNEIISQPLAWWPDFFTYAAGKAASVDTVRALAAMQSSGPNRMMPAGRRALLQRLQRDGLWFDAYTTWLNGLTRDQTKLIGNLFNGDFEGELSNIGFDWIVTPAPQVVIETANTYGAAGNKALRVLFRGPRIQFRNLHQYLMLTPGNYALRGRVRPDHLETPEGVRWSIYCLGRSEAIAQSETFRGSDHWQHFAVRFDIPPKDCMVQTIRLELVGRSALDYVAKGGIWFDDMSISRRRLD